MGIGNHVYTGQLWGVVGGLLIETDCSYDPQSNTSWSLYQGFGHLITASRTTIRLRLSGKSRNLLIARSSPPRSPIPVLWFDVLALWRILSQPSKTKIFTGRFSQIQVFRWWWHDGASASGLFTAIYGQRKEWVGSSETLQHHRYGLGLIEDHYFSNLFTPLSNLSPHVTFLGKACKIHKKGTLLKGTALSLFATSSDNCIHSNHLNPG